MIHTYYQSKVVVPITVKYRAMAAGYNNFFGGGIQHTIKNSAKRMLEHSMQ